MHNLLVKTKIEGGIATLTLARPEAANALSEAMLGALETALQQVETDGNTRVIIIAAEGKIFCAGHDLAEMRTHEDKPYFDQLFERCSHLMLSIRRATKPVIAQVQGAAVAAGCQLVASCDLAYAADHAKFGVNGINLGLFCSTPAVALSRAVPPRQALELLLTGDLINAARACDLGLINAVVPAAELSAHVLKMATTIASKQADAVSLGKRLFWQQLQQDEAIAYQTASNCMATNIGLPETQNRIDAFLAKHK
ncbi:MAG TPA: enoyl-CoA hydratase [Aestuariivirga sp.]